jgi:hypothetical protein
MSATAHFPAIIAEFAFSSDGYYLLLTIKLLSPHVKVFYTHDSKIMESKGQGSSSHICVMFWPSMVNARWISWTKQRGATVPGNQAQLLALLSVRSSSESFPLSLSSSAPLPTLLPTAVPRYSGIRLKVIPAEPNMRIFIILSLATSLTLVRTYWSSFRRNIQLNAGCRSPPIKFVLDRPLLPLLQHLPLPNLTQPQLHLLPQVLP